MTFNKIIGFLIFLAFISCKEYKKEIQVVNENHNPPLFTLLDSSNTGIKFINEIKLHEDFNIFTYRNFYNGGGVAIGDINNDGLADIYLTSNLGKNKLYLNKGQFKFEDITVASHAEGLNTWSTGVVMVDINSDGFLDIYVCNAGNVKGDNQKNELFINNGDLTFTEEAEMYNLADSGFTTHAAFFDYDKDGDLDAYILNNSFIPVNSLNYSNKRTLRDKDWNVPELLKGGGDKLMQNINGKFVDVSEEAGIYGSLIGFGLGVTVGDINGDLYPDIYVSNDFYERDYLYINNQDGTFTEDINNWASRLSLSSMGADMADINNDGKPDIYVTDMLPEEDSRLKSTTSFEGYDIYKRKLYLDFHHQYMQNTLQLNIGNNTFSEIAYFANVAKTDWSWGALLFDMDNDGYKDIYVCNGIYHDLTNQDFIDFFANDIIQKMVLSGKKEAIDSIVNKMPSVPIPNYAFKNNKDLSFTNQTKTWGFDIPSFSNGAAYGDLDNDGDLDLVINNVNQELFLYKNNSREQLKNNYLKIQLKGNSANTFGIGSYVDLYLKNGEIIHQELIPSRGFQSSMDYVMTIGLGDANSIDSLRVIWPDDSTQKLTHVNINQLLVLKQIEATEKFRIPRPQKIKTLFTEIHSDQLTAHKENNYVDFDYEGLISKMLSQEGPALAVGDINGDGNEDIFIGGAKMQPGTVYLNNGNGNLKTTPQKALEADAGFEDTASAFFDADGDGDLDLMVGTGGNQVGEEKTYRTRLYLNNGKGIFTKSEPTLPSTFKNISVIAPYDFDNDGDIDVFVGSRSVVGTYGVNPDHLFLENNGDGTFKNSTERIAYGIKDAGMVTNAIWADVDGDHKKDLVTVSDWGSPMVFKNSGRSLFKLATSLDELHGWWNVLEAADLDNDGDNDFIIGNQGKNLPYKASVDNRMKMWVNDFDNNGTIEQIVTQHKNGHDYPIHMKKELTAQLVSLKKENLKASDYAKRSIEQLFAPEILQNSIVKQANTSETVIAINEGNGKFTIKNLPDMVQFSCVCGIVCSDVDNDGNLDLIMAGNNYEFKPQFSRLDSNYGSVLLGDGNAGFTWQKYDQSGFFVRDEVKHLKTFKDKSGKSYIIAAINNQEPKIFRINE